MTEWGAAPSGAEPPPLGPADVYLHAHGNGAVFLFHPDRRSRFVTLAEAVAVADACGAAEGRVFLSGDDSEPMAEHVVAAVRATGAPVVDYLPPRPPYEWHDGADALMMAAAYGQDELLDDLLQRGADVRATNDGGVTALHHAAADGNVYAIDRLLAAGADPDARNAAGLTPHMAALACKEHDAAARLEAGAAVPAHADTTRARFRRSHYLPVAFPLAASMVFAAIAAALVAPLGSAADWVVVTAVALAGLLLFAPRALRTGVVPRSIDGPRLRVRTLSGRSLDVNLDDVSTAAYAPGVGGRGGRPIGTKLVLVHPQGRAFTRRSLRWILLPAEEADALPDNGGRATVVVLDGWWEHEVLRPVGNRLISGLADLTPNVRQRLRQARHQDPSQPATRGRTHAAWLRNQLGGRR